MLTILYSRGWTQWLPGQLVFQTCMQVTVGPPILRIPKDRLHPPSQVRLQQAQASVERCLVRPVAQMIASPPASSPP
jgi:hypothetical protein